MEVADLLRRCFIFYCQKLLGLHGAGSDQIHFLSVFNFSTGEEPVLFLLLRDRFSRTGSSAQQNLLDFCSETF